MARHKHIPYVVLGTGDKPTKGVVTTKNEDMSGYWLHFVEIKNGGDIERGETFNQEAITGIYQSIYFARIESVDALIKALEKLKNRWESDEVKLS